MRNTNVSSTEVKTAYICRVSWECEVGSTYVKIYPSIESLKEDHDCWEECGIIQLQLQPVKVAHEGDLC